MPAIFQACRIISCLLGAILPSVDARTTLLIVLVATLEGVSILEVYLAIAVRAALPPLALKDSTLKKECAVTLALVLLPLPIVDGAILAAHYSKSFLMAVCVAKAHIDLAFRNFWRCGGALG